MYLSSNPSVDILANVPATINVADNIAPSPQNIIYVNDQGFSSSQTYVQLSIPGRVNPQTYLSVKGNRRLNIDLTDTIIVGVICQSANFLSKIGFALLDGDSNRIAKS